MSVAATSSVSVREARRARTRERLFESALAEFRAEGVAGASIDRIATAAGVARGTFYFHFPTREDVLVELQRRLESDVVQRLAQRRRPRSVKGFLEQAIQACLDVIEGLDDPALLNELLAMYVRRPREVTLEDAPFLLELVRYFEDAAARGEVRDDVAPTRLMGIFGRMLFGLLLQAPAAEPERRFLIRDTIAVLVRGMSP